MTALRLADGEVDLAVTEYETAVVFTDENEARHEVPVTGASGTFFSEEDGITYLWGDFDEKFYLQDIPAEVECDYRVVIWVDGADPDCVNAIMGGDVLLELRLSAEKITSEVEQ